MYMTLFIAGLLALGVIVLLLPLARRQSDLGEVDDADFFRARLKELERDRARGVIEDKEADEARIEASRALLVAEARDAENDVKPSLFRRRVATLFAVLTVPAVSLGLYYNFGSPALLDAPLAQRMAEITDNNNFEAMVAQVEKRLNEKPDDGLGWATIAPVYADLGRYEDAVKAFQNAITYQGETADLRAGLGEARLALANGVVTAEARVDFDRALELDPENQRALYYRAVSIEQDGKKDEAISAYRDLLARLDASSNAATLVKKRITDLEGMPGQEGLAADADQSAMIRGMVERLDQRLTSDGSDVEGWARLMRAYQVLGDLEKAKGAVERAKQALQGNAEALKQIEQSASELGLN